METLGSPNVVLALACVGITFLLSLLLTGSVRHWARRWGFLDIPGGHKAHAAPVALGGGVAITWSFALVVCAGLVVVLLLPIDRYPWFGWITIYKSGLLAKLPGLLIVLAGAMVLHAVGLLDDVRPLPAWGKLLAQVAVATLVVLAADVRAVQFLGTVPSIALTVLWLVAICNSINLLDNIDGLCAGVVAICAAVLAASAVQAGQVFVPALAWTLAGAALGFWVFNFPPASIFMGDAGSLPLGFLLAVLTVLTTYYNPELRTQPYGVVSPLFILAVPLYDTASVMFIRRRLGVSVFRGDRRHFSHRLLRRGMSTAAAVLTIYLATATTGVSALLLPWVGWKEAFWLTVQCVCVLSIVAILESTGGNAEAEVTK